MEIPLLMRKIQTEQSAALLNTPQTMQPEATDCMVKRIKPIWEQ
jgi:hypothetical protein